MSNHSKASHGIEFGELARATEGLTQWRPMLVGFGSLLLCGVLMAIAGATVAGLGNFFGVVLAGLLGLLALVVMFGGFSAVGIMLMDKARNLPPRSLTDAMTLGVLCIPRFLLFVLMLFVLTLGVGLVAAVLYLLCKVPLLGALLAFFVHPALVLVTAFLMVAVMFVAIPLFAPAVWSGLSFRQAMTSLVAIARKRLVQVVLMLIVLYLIVMVVTGLLFVGLVPATALMSTVAAGILSPSSFVNIFSMLMNAGLSFMMGSGGGALAGAMAGMAVLLTVVSALIAQVWIMGFNLMYLQAAQGVDLSETSQDLGKVMATIKTGAEAVKESAVAAADRARQVAAERAAAAKAAQSAAASAPPQEAPAAGAVGGGVQPDASPVAQQLHCPACQAVAQPQDMFCCECGHRLRS